MNQLDVYDPAMCCSTGLCGTTVDPTLVQFAADLGWLRNQGVVVQRFNLSKEPMAFVNNDAVKQIVNQTQGKGLPVLVVAGQVVSQGRYPSCSELAAFVHLAVDPTLSSFHLELPVVDEVKANAGGSCCSK